MKIVGILAGVAAVGVAAWQIWMSVTNSNTEEQPYEVLEKSGDLELRQYPAAVMITVKKQGEYRNMMNQGFRDLAGYIFGGNKRSQKIAMTAPVISEPEEDGMNISFVLPSDMEFDEAPQPQNEAVNIHESNPETAAAITFGGFADEGKMMKEGDRLLRLVAEKGWTPAGPVRYLYYNPPFQLVNRRNEVLVPVKIDS